MFFMERMSSILSVPQTKRVHLDDALSAARACYILQYLLVEQSCESFQISSCTGVEKMIVVLYEHDIMDFYVCMAM